VIPVPPEHESVKGKGFWYLMLNFMMPKRPFDEDARTNCFEDHVNQESLQKSIDLTIEVLRVEVGILQDSEKVFLGGFSRGVGVALGAYLQYDEILGGVFCYAGMFCLDLDWQSLDLEKKKRTPVFLYYGEDDWFIKPRKAEMSFEYMNMKGLDHYKYVKEPNLQHAMDTGCMKHLSDFFGLKMKNQKAQDEMIFDVKRT
jgi:predicted esterase